MGRTPTHKNAGNKIRLLFLIGELGMGGSERQLYLLLKHLDRNLFEPHIIVFNTTPYDTLDAHLEQVGVQVHPIPEASAGVARRIWYILKLTRRLRPQIIHSWTVHDNPYAGLVGILARIPVRLGSVRGTIHSPGITGLPNIYQWLIFHSVNGLVINSSAIHTELLNKGLPNNKIQHIPNCVELPNNESPIVDLSSLGIPDNQRIVGIVANLHGVKNHLMFIEGMSQVLPEFPDTSALIIGQPVRSHPDLMDHLKDIIKGLGMQKRIIFAGFRPDVIALLQRFDVFCLTSNSEGMPNAVMEAMAAGLPVVATRVGGVPDLVQDGVTGYLVEPGDIKGFAEAIRKLLLDPDFAERMGKAGLDRVSQKHSCAQSTASLSAYFLDTLRSKGFTFSKNLDDQAC